MAETVHLYLKANGTDIRYINAGGVNGDAGDYRAKFPDGRMASDPSLATAADGETLLAAAVEDVAEAYRAFVAA